MHVMVAVDGSKKKKDPAREYKNEKLTTETDAAKTCTTSAQIGRSAKPAAK